MNSMKGKSLFQNLMPQEVILRVEVGKKWLKEAAILITKQVILSNFPLKRDKNILIS